MRRIISPTRSAYLTARAAADRALPRSGVSPSSQCKQVLPLVTTADKGWMISWAMGRRQFAHRRQARDAGELRLQGLGPLSILDIGARPRSKHFANCRRPPGPNGVTGKPITGRGLVKLLRPFDIRPRHSRTGSTYERRSWQRSLRMTVPLPPLSHPRLQVSQASHVKKIKSFHRVKRRLPRALRSLTALMV